MSLKDNAFETVDQLRWFLYKTTSDSQVAELYDVFISGEAVKLYWIYPLTYEDGTTITTIDYSVSGGGGWLNISVPAPDFIKGMARLLEWPMTLELRETLQAYQIAIIDKIGHS